MTQIRASPDGRQGGRGLGLGLAPMLKPPRQRAWGWPATQAIPPVPAPGSRKLPRNFLCEGTADEGDEGDKGGQPTWRRRGWPGPLNSEFQGAAPGTVGGQPATPPQLAVGVGGSRLAASTLVRPTRAHGPACLPAVWFGPKFSLSPAKLLWKRAITQ